MTAKMIRFGQLLWSISLTVHMSTSSSLEIFGPDSDDVICSQSVSECTMKDEIPLLAGNDDVDVTDLRPHVKLCSKNNQSCSVCLVIDVELRFYDLVHEGSSELDDYEASVTVCYKTPFALSTCKKVEFTVNHMVFMQERPTKISMVITRPSGVSYGSKISVYPPSYQHLTQHVDIPSLDKVCFLEVKKCVEECHVPKVKIVMGRDFVKLLFDNSNNKLTYVCVQYEENGTCQKLNSSTIPLYSVTSCMCFMAWYHDQTVRTKLCPFTRTAFSKRTVWENVSVNVGQGQTSDYSSRLLWSLSAPCRLKGVVWPCLKKNSCKEIKGFRHQLKNGAWSFNKKGHWEHVGVIEDIDLDPPPCIMLKIEGMRQQLGPFCFRNTDRHHWTLMLTSVIIVLLLMMFLWFCRDFIKVGRKTPLILVSPPDTDTAVLELVRCLGSLLCKQGFDVAVDQWCRTEQSNLGPLLWLHSQLLMNQYGYRVVIVLTQNGLDKLEEWAKDCKEVIPNEKETDCIQIESPYSDVFTASLSIIQKDKQCNRAAERFLLVKFDSSPVKNSSFPEILQGLPLFHFPSQTQVLLTELSLKKTGQASGKQM